MYGILNTCFMLSRYLEFYFRHNDILAVNNDLTETLPISTLFDWTSILATSVKRNLEEHILPPYIDYKESVDLIMNKLQIFMVNIDHNRLEPFEDYSIVIDTQPLHYKVDDG